MTLEELIETYPEAETYFKNMPEELKTRYTIGNFRLGPSSIRKIIPWIISGSYAVETTG